MIYIDTSALVALYFPEARTARVQAHLRRRRSALPFTWLHEIEFTNSLRLKLFRGEATNAAVTATLAAVRADVEIGVFAKAPVIWPRVFEGTLRLSAAYSHRLGTRTLDLLHIASACDLGVKEFVTSDLRQADAAEKEGLKVMQIA
ncbi:MAG: type II toxin-antitoxin system VapC family toxin [Verrucomicrobiales bacterium]